MNCLQCEDLFASYIEGLLNDELVGEFEKHIADCSTCPTSLEETRQTIDRLTQDGKEMSTFSMSTAVMDQILQQQSRQLRRLPMVRFVKFAVAASLLATACAGIAYLVSAVGGGTVYADVPEAVKQIERANTATWKQKFYQRRIRDDTAGQTRINDHIEHQTREYAYKAPGLYRDVTRDENGRVTSIEIKDSIGLKRLRLSPTEKKATLFHLSQPDLPASGLFTDVMEYLRSDNLEWLGEKEIAGSKANGFRHEFWFERTNENVSYDFWIDAETKHLVAHQVPGVNILDPDKVYDKKPASNQGRSGFLKYDIRFGVELDDSLFSFDVPEGYTLQVEHAVKVTEKEVIEFLGMVAAYTDNTFPDRMPQFDYGAEQTRLKQVQAKSKEERTPVENRLVETIDKYMQMSLGGPGPTYEFMEANIVEGSWMYIGKGVKLGDGERIVCWYRPKGSQKFNVVYGDLSVKSMAADDLPLQVEP